MNQKDDLSIGQLTRALDQEHVIVEGIDWELFVIDMRPRSPREWLLLIATFGPLNLEVMLRIDPRFGLERVTNAVLRSVHDWLLAGGHIPSSRIIDMVASIVRGTFEC